MTRLLGKLPARRLSVIGVIVVALSAAAGAGAYFSTSASGTAHASVGNLGVSAITSATPGAGTVALAWSTVNPPAGSTAVKYYVVRDGGAPAGTCPTSTATATTATACTDSGLSTGSHTYDVVSVWQSWTGTSTATTVRVTTGAASQLVLSQSTDSVKSGNNDTLTAKIEDSAGNTVTSGPDSTDNVTLSQTGGTGSVQGLGTVAASGGIATDTVTGYSAGSVSLQASAKLGGASTASASNTVTTTVTAGNPASISVQSGAGQSTTVNTAFGSPLVALVRDSAGNPVPGATVTFSAPSSGASATLATSAATTASDGTASSGSVTANTVAGSYSATASTSGVGSSASFSLTNTPGAAKTLAVTGYPSPATSGTSNNFKVTANDQYGNIATGYAGTVAFTSSAASRTLPANYTFTGSGTGKDNGQHTFNATLNTAGTQSITATDTATSSITGSQTGIVVTASKLVLSAASTGPVAGATDNLTITAQDAAGNTATNYTGDKTLTFTGAAQSPNSTNPTVTNKSGTSVAFGNTETIAFINGVANTSTAGATGQLAMILYNAATSSILVTDGTIKNGSGLSITVGGPQAPSGSSTKYTYTDITSPTPDTIAGANGTIPTGNESQSSLKLVALETTGPHVGSSYTSAFAASNGSVAAFNADSSTINVAYKFESIDPWGNVSSTVGPFSFTDAK